jgi:hypothetical protein
MTKKLIYVELTVNDNKYITTSEWKWEVQRSLNQKVSLEFSEAVDFASKFIIIDESTNFQT